MTTLEWVGDGSRSHSRSMTGVLWTVDYNRRTATRTSESDGDGVTLAVHGIPMATGNLQALAQRLQDVLDAPSDLVSVGEVVRVLGELERSAWAEGVSEMRLNGALDWLPQARAAVRSLAPGEG